MTVVVLERAPDRLRGALTRWFLELRTGVYVGTVSARVRDHLWEMIKGDLAGGAALMVHSARTEQGFAIRAHGDPSREVFDIDGLLLVRIPAKYAAKSAAGGGRQGETDGSETSGG